MTKLITNRFGSTSLENGPKIEPLDKQLRENETFLRFVKEKELDPQSIGYLVGHHKGHYELRLLPDRTSVGITCPLDDTLQKLVKNYFFPISNEPTSLHDIEDTPSKQPHSTKKSETPSPPFSSIYCPTETDSNYSKASSVIREDQNSLDDGIRNRGAAPSNRRRSQANFLSSQPSTSSHTNQNNSLHSLQDFLINLQKSVHEMQRSMEDLRGQINTHPPLFPIQQESTATVDLTPMRDDLTQLNEQMNTARTQLERIQNQIQTLPRSFPTIPPAADHQEEITAIHNELRVLQDLVRQQSSEWNTLRQTNRTLEPISTKEEDWKIKYGDLATKYRTLDTQLIAAERKMKKIESERDTLQSKTHAYAIKVKKQRSDLDTKEKLNQTILEELQTLNSLLKEKEQEQSVLNKRIKKLSAFNLKESREKADLIKEIAALEEVLQASIDPQPDNENLSQTKEEILKKLTDLIGDES